jgi:hypothetical protein
MTEAPGNGEDLTGIISLFEHPFNEVSALGPGAMSSRTLIRLLFISLVLFRSEMFVGIVMCQCIVSNMGYQPGQLGQYGIVTNF